MVAYELDIQIIVGIWSMINQVEVSLKLEDTMCLHFKGAKWFGPRFHSSKKFLLAGPVTMPLCCPPERLWNRYPLSDKPSNLFEERVSKLRWITKMKRVFSAYQEHVFSCPRLWCRNPLRLFFPHKSSLETGMLTWTPRASIQLAKAWFKSLFHNRS